MPEARLRPKGQVTIPAAILETARVDIHSTFEVAVINGVITLTPKSNQGEKREDIMAFAGMFKETWGKTPVQVEKTLNDLRDEWER
jgi:bifunctional DNA-binding transcriptional regulator/antitoxin component of YhaV-PrlF toxin-antitoxin module